MCKDNDKNGDKTERASAETASQNEGGKHGKHGKIGKALKTLPTTAAAALFTCHVRALVAGPLLKGNIFSPWHFSPWIRNKAR